ncbi:MAG: flagellar hook protein FlgE [Thermodesulfobacteriota bacterium]
MIKSLSTGVSGLNANATAMGVIGDNIANVKTVGFKANSVTFSNLLSQAIEGRRAGDGVRIWDVATSFAQGAPETTGNSTDLAITGNGFFVVRDGGGTSRYTRAGQFSLDKNGYMVNPDGLILQGKPVTEVVPETGELRLGGLGDIRVSTDTSPPQSTSEMQLTMNLDAEATTNYETSLTVYDSLGGPITLRVTLEPDPDSNDWSWTATVDPSAIEAPGDPDTPVVVGNGTFSFDANGNLANTANGEVNITGLASGAEDLSIEWRYLSEETGLTDGTITAYSSESSTIKNEQDGFPSGSLQRIAVDEEGVVAGIFSNGEITPLYRISLANFSNYQGLTGEGDNLYAASISSGAPTVGEAGAGPFGRIAAGSLEMSNVDLSSEFVNLITTQRAFQANSKVITTSDEILAELMNLKR